jgi:hypothetical protein
MKNKRNDDYYTLFINKLILLLSLISYSFVVYHSVTISKKPDNFKNIPSAEFLIFCFSMCSRLTIVFKTTTQSSVWIDKPLKLLLFIYKQQHDVKHEEKETKARGIFLSFSKLIVNLDCNGMQTNMKPA